MTATFLERENDRFSVETATDADEGLERLVENEYDCVVSDYDMPGNDGIEFLKSVREKYLDLPFILFTGKGSEEVASEAISAGVTDYPQKESGADQYELLANKVANAELHGMTPEELEGRQEREIEPEVGNTENFDKYRQREAKVIETGESTTFEEELMDPDGEKRVFKTTRIPFEAASTEEDVVLGYARDVTSLKEYEQELEQSNEKLDGFASVVSHDLRNPLSVAKGRLELAQEGCDSEHLDHVEGALERMDALIEDILTLAREGSGVGEMEVVETQELLEDCWGNVGTENSAVVNELERKVEADPNRLEQLFENLLRNAIEHGGDDVTVTVGELEDGNGFYIADDGDGIPEEERDEVFERGYSTSEDGTGFGLSIVEEIVTAHGWEIRITDSDDGGARFEVVGVETVE